MATERVAKWQSSESPEASFFETTFYSEEMISVKARLHKCLSSIILSPLNGYVKMSPYEQGDISLESERVATSGCDFILREGGSGVCPSRRTARSNPSAYQAPQIALSARR